LNSYGGHIHQLRFRQGHTYGEETHLLSKEFPHLRRRQSLEARSDISDPYVTREFPDGLIPGYAGNTKTSFFSLNIIIHQVMYLN